MRSDLIKSGFERAPHRCLLKATGVITDDADFEKIGLNVSVTDGQYTDWQVINITTVVKN